MTSDDNRHDRERAEWNRIQNKRLDAIDEAKRIKYASDAARLHVTITALNNEIADRKAAKSAGNPEATRPPVPSLNDLGSRKRAALDDLKAALAKTRKRLGECYELHDQWMEDWEEHLDLIARQVGHDARAAGQQASKFGDEVRECRAAGPHYSVQSWLRDRRLNTQLEFLGYALTDLEWKCTDYATCCDEYDDHLRSLVTKPPRLDFQLPFDPFRHVPKRFDFDERPGGGD